MLTLRGGTVVDTEGERTADVGVEDGVVTHVGEVPDESDREIDVDGNFVVPGLIDAHVHLMMDGRADSASVTDDGRYVMAYRAADHLRELVASGVTTVRDLGAPTPMAIDAGRAVEEGFLPGPSVVACGQNITMTGGHGHWFGTEADGRAAVRKAAREQIKRGAGVVKCTATGGILTRGAQIGAPELEREELSTIADAAAAKDVPTAAHAHGTEGIKNATRAGISSIEHGTFMDAEAAELMAERGTYWVPTAKALHEVLEHADDPSLPGYVSEKADEAAEGIDAAFDHALAADVPVAMGTDAGTPFNAHGDSAEELEWLVSHGLSPEAALEAATVNAADLLGLADRGRVRPGQRADLLVLDANPLEDVTAWQTPSNVIAAGDPV